MLMHLLGQRFSCLEILHPPLMPMYWAFELEPIVRRNLYIDRLKETQTITEVLHAITKFRGECPGKGWEEMPV